MTKDGWTLQDFQVGTNPYGKPVYMDSSGDYISEEEALAEVEWMNGGRDEAKEAADAWLIKGEYDE